MIYTIPEDGVVFTRKPGFFGNPIVSVKVLRDRITYTRKKSDIPETVMFSDINKVSSSILSTNDANFSFYMYKKDGGSVTLDLDPGSSSTDVDNCVQTKTCLTAYTQFVLGEHFPDNIDELDINISENLREKAGVTLLSHGQLIINGVPHQTQMLANAVFVDQQVGQFLNLTFADGSKEKQKYLSSLNLTVIEAIMMRNTGHGINFSTGDGIKHRTADWARYRTIDDNCFRK